MRILVIGGTRFIGPPAVTSLYEMGHTLMLFHRQPTTLDLPEHIEHVYGDRRQHLANFGDTFRRFEPDVVLDMMPVTEQDARELMGTFKGMAWRVVAISSADVYRAYGRLTGTEPGDPDPVPMTEEAPLREKLYPYRTDKPRADDDPMRWTDDYDKILVERVVMGDPGLPGTVLRLPMVYGPQDYQHRMSPYLKRMLDDRPAILLDERTARWRTTRGYVENVGAAIAQATVDERAAGRIYNVGESSLSEVEWVRQIGEAAGWHGEIVVAPDDVLPDSMRAGEELEQDLVTDTLRIRNELGFDPPIAFEDGIRRTVDWESAHFPPQAEPLDYTAEDEVLQRLHAR
jgi:nucleoside-diphosphate-sugar epimerase